MIPSREVRTDYQNPVKWQFELAIMLCFLWVLELFFAKMWLLTEHSWYLLKCWYVCLGEYGDSEQFEILIEMTLPLLLKVQGALWMETKCLVSTAFYASQVLLQSGN